MVRLLSVRPRGSKATTADKERTPKLVVGQQRMSTWAFSLVVGIVCVSLVWDEAVLLNLNLSSASRSTTVVHVVDSTRNTSSVGRSLAYTQLPESEKYQNKTILFVFAGREKNLITQILYLERLVLTGELDYVHYFHCQPSESDSAWLYNLQSILNSTDNGGWFELKRLTPDCGPNRFNSVFHHYQDTQYLNSTFVKVDDDIVLFPLDGTFTKLVHYAQTHPEAHWTSALCLNNPLVDHYLQLDAAIPVTPTMNFTSPPQEPGYGPGKINLGVRDQTWYEDTPNRHSLNELHTYILSHPKQLYTFDGVFLVPPGYRTALNFSKFLFCYTTRCSTLCLYMIF
jgi:hypothetical protein